MNRRPILRRLAFALVTFVATLLIVEIGLRLLVAPSDLSFGRFLGRELPPLELIPYSSDPPATDRDAWHEDLVVDGTRVSAGDLWGFQREDPELGYAPLENAISRNGWWRSNNLGAREDHDTPAERPAGKLRMLVFGDSYAQGSRIRQQDVWPHVLEQAAKDLDVVNLGVDGYSMAQSLLRYRQIRGRVDYDLVLFVFVPIKDLWRDINTVRSLAKDWDYYTVLPRFVIVDGAPVLVQSPYRDPSEIYARNSATPSAELIDHLERFDRFYFEREFAQPRFLGKSVLYKIGLRGYLVFAKRRLYKRLDPESEAVQVTRGIFRLAQAEADVEGVPLILTILPSHTDLKLLRNSSSYASAWSRTVESICGDEIFCIDLSPELLAAPRESLDRGYDGSHFGPRANRLIAEAILERLSESGRTPRAIRHDAAGPG